MDITKMSDTELKALAYDQMAQIQLSQGNLQVINTELAKRNQPAEEAKPTEESTKKK
jgi:hypothetical protein